MSARYFCIAVSATGALAITAFAVPAASASTPRDGVTLSGHPLGVNVAPWQTANLNTAARQRMESALKQLGPAIAVRYGGGVFADADNQVIGRNTNGISQAGSQTSDFWGDGSYRDALTFDRYVPEARGRPRQRHGDDQLRDRNTRTRRGMARQHPRAWRSGDGGGDRQRAVRLAWLAEGARNVNWWGEPDGNNAYGHCAHRDFSIFNLTGYPLPPYEGFLLASKLASRTRSSASWIPGTATFSPTTPR